jgi:hypothetical protein
MDELSTLPQVDQDAIGITLMALLSGFQERNADKLASVYSADADWVNASGASSGVRARSLSISGACLRTITSTQGQ